ncbi:MAG: M20/M25/M40 family metallo-hydrolase [Euryarchaeota archaeon]|nr:M20/M25/M40 family metallo-hydrolase [Euryarchaeota archaeon]
MDLLDVIRDLVFVQGISGYEDDIRSRVIEYLKKFGEPKVDKLGNVYLTLGDGDEHIAFMAHMDEIGLVVAHIEENGFIRLKRLGGVDVRMLYGQYFEVFTKDGKRIPGVIGLKPPHISTESEMKNAPPIEDLYLDVGASSREEVISMGISILDPVRWMKQFHVLNGRYIVTRGLDDRAGCAILINLIERLKGKKLKKKVTFIFTLQEETGLRGAKAITERDIDELYAIDSVSSGDIPKVDYYLSPVSLGKGPVIRFIDARGANSISLKRKVEKIASRNKINIQEVFTGGSTDAAGTFDLGIPSIALCFPIRYTHTTVEMSSIEDIEALINLLEKIVQG